MFLARIACLQNDRGLLRATVVAGGLDGVERTPNKSPLRKLNLKKKSLPPFSPPGMNRDLPIARPVLYQLSYPES